MLYILLQGGGNSSLITPLFMLAFLAVFYFFFIRPQAKKQKEQSNFIENLEKGQEIVTGSGIIGKINKLDDNEVQLQVDQKTFIRMTRGAISKEMTDAYNKIGEKK